MSWDHALYSSPSSPSKFEHQRRFVHCSWAQAMAEVILWPSWWWAWLRWVEDDAFMYLVDSDDDDDDDDDSEISIHDWLFFQAIGDFSGDR